MRTEQLQYLCETVAQGSINATAEKLHLTQQGLNASLKSLEKELGYPLLITSRQGITLTPQGELVLEAAKKVQQILDDLTLSLQQNELLNLQYSPISIYTAPVVSEYFFPEFFQIISKKYSQMIVKTIEQEALQIIDSVKNGLCDLGLLGIQHHLLSTLNISNLLPEQLVFKPLYHYKLSLAVSEYHPLAQYKTISLKTAIQYPIILYTANSLEDDLNYQWLKLFDEPQIKYVTTSRTIYYNILKSGTAIGILPDERHGKLTISIPDGIKRIPFNSDDAEHIVGYLYDKNHEISTTMQLIISELEKFCT